ncbi:MAG TPA: type I-U CRISPR-associated protein Csb2 [Conexibacter sp.]|jgi:CRISPR-associated protein Csb2|nr:type I-U CRISPR-associated protein Csb2 [Conexibacter sp.]
MLAIRCQFLQGTYQASPPGRLTESEWPPHPGRLHAALVASGWAWGGDSFPDEAADALAWFEEQPAPAILVPPGSGAVRRSPTTYVPRNLTPRETAGLIGHLRRGDHTPFQRGFGRVARTFPTRIVGDEPIWFVWPDAEPSPARARALERLAGELQYLGSSRSPVLGKVFLGPGDAIPWTTEVEQESRTQTFAPAQGGYGQRDLRVAYSGLAKTLVGNRETGSRAPLGPSVAYVRKSDAVDPTPVGEVRCSGAFAAMVIKKRTGFGLTVSHTTTLTEAFRAACLAVAGDEAPAALHGHGDHPHAAYLALPNVGGRHSDGVVLGLGVAIPNTASEATREAIRAAVAGVDQLIVERGALKWGLGDVKPENAARTLQAQRWMGPARRWSTVTPVILDRHPKPSRGFSLEDALRLSFKNALLPEPSDEGIEVSSTPMLSGAVAPASHIRPTRLRGPALHVTVTFPSEVVGPVLVGKGRYLGLGLFAPIASPQGEAADEGSGRRRT